MATRAERSGLSRLSVAESSKIVVQRSPFFGGGLSRSASHASADKFRELLHVSFSRVPRAHPAEHQLPFLPHIEAVALLQLVDNFARNFDEDSVGFDFLFD